MLKKGDKVNFEYADDLTTPRWDFGCDNGSSEKFGEGSVVEANETQFSVEYKYYSEDRWDVWNFTYDDKNKPGFPTKIVTEEEQKNIDALHNWLKG